jgi:uncharacterized membrane protein
MATIQEGPHGHPRSTARIGGHPIHPMLVSFPIVCFVLNFVADVIYIQNRSPGWATATHWLLAIGLGFAALAAVAGLTDFLGDKRIQTADAVKHMLANVTAVVIELINLILRLNNPEFIPRTGVILSAVVVLILLYSGWKGGDLVFRHGIGVED